MKRIYCYIDESGQDVKSEIFVVVAIVSFDDQNDLKKIISDTEESTKIFKRKWHKSRYKNKYQFLEQLMEKKIAKGNICFSRYKKPIPYFFPIIDTVEKAIILKHFKDYRATIYIDGIDKKKSAELTNALRIRKIKLNFVKSCRDESEPLIRLADRWAGCIRGALLERINDIKLFSKAKKIGYLIDVQKQ